MRKGLGPVAAAAALLLGGPAPAELMLCVHQDGSVALERFQETCCGEERLPACPDDQCRDLPLMTGPEEGLATSSFTPAAPSFRPLDLEAVSFEISFATTRPLPHHGALDPPGSPTLDVLRC